LAAMRLGAIWKPGKARDAARGKQLVRSPSSSRMPMNRSSSSSTSIMRPLLPREIFFMVYPLLFPPPPMKPSQHISKTPQPLPGTMI
jgi:hypothetical protein